MNTKWLVETNGDPLGAIQNIFIETWERFELDSMVIPTNGNGVPHILHDPEEIRLVNPFKPVMIFNSAKHLPQILDQLPEARIGALLRPCEVRALNAKIKRETIPPDRVLTVCVDCLGTYSLEDYQWRVERRGSPEHLDRETLYFARQGGIAAYRFRSACQACQTPIGNEADINVGVIGLPVRQKVLVEVRDQAIAKTLSAGKSISTVDQPYFEQRDYVTSRLLERVKQTRQRLVANLGSILPRDLDGLINQYERCGECRSCFESCPLCAADYPAKDEAGLYEREQVMQWVISCAGCGMCEQACPNHLPLVTVFANIRQQLDDVKESTLVH
ncbi:MAG: Coenzyme F420 hydrogenase/dehydrogenase, beta subunit C-terminal domain [Anaerolineales bacterium]